MFGFKKNKSGFGLQILDTQIRLVQIEQAGHFVQIVQQHSVALQAGCVKNGKIQNEEALIETLGDAVRKLGLGKAKVNLTVPTSNVILRKASFPSLKDKELRNLIDVELHGSNQLPFKNPVFDFVRLGRSETEAAATATADGKGAKTAEQEEVLIFATPLETVESYVDVVQEAGLEPISIDLVPLALYRLLVRNTRLTNDVLPPSFGILRMEADHADFSIYENGIPVFFRSMPVNASYMLDSASDPAEAYGRNLGIELGRVLNYYKYSVSTGQQDVQALYLTGEGEWLTKMDAHLQGAFQGKMSLLPLGAVLQSQDNRHHAYAVPLGLAMKGA